MQARKRRRLRVGLLWAATIGLAGYGLFSPWATSDVTPPDAPDDSGSGAEERLKITALSHTEVLPGDAVVVRISGLSPDLPVTATIDKIDAGVLRGRDNVAVVQVPVDAESGRAALRLSQGDRKAKPRDLVIRRAEAGQVGLGVLGGLALSVFALGLLADGFARVASRGDRERIATATRGSPRSLLIGSALGVVTQLSTSAAGIASGLVEARLVPLASAVIILVGAQVGAVVSGAFLPTAAGAAGLTLVGIGVVWAVLGPHRRATAIGQSLIGTGLLVHGVHTLATALAPVLGDAQVLGHLAELEQAGSLALLGAAALGVAAALVGQGPGPAVALAIGIARETGGIATSSLLAFAAGAALGGAIGAAVIVAPARRDGRRLAVAILALWSLGAIALLAEVPLWSALARWLEGSLSPDRAFAVAAIAAYSTTGALLAVGAAVWQRAVGRDAGGTARKVDEMTVRRELGAVLSGHKAALHSIAALIASGNRDHSVAAEEPLLLGARAIEDLHLATRGSEAPPTLAGATVATLQAARSIEQLLRLAEMTVDRNVVLTPEDAAGLADLQRIVVEGLEGLGAALASGAPPDLEAARMREILLNSAEARRRGISTSSRVTGGTGSIWLGAIELFDAYENVGNKVFRIYEALAAGPLDDLA